MKLLSLLASLLFLNIICEAQSKEKADLQTSTNKWQIGAELDVLPYITGGYFAAAWAGKNHIRLRALTAYVKKPDFSTKEAFANHRIHAYALVADYFLKPGWKGFWIGGGPVLWQSTIQTNEEKQTASFNNWLLNGSAGYHFRIGKQFYLSPWAGLSLSVGGDKKTPVDGTTFTLPLLNPEASLKAGMWF